MSHLAVFEDAVECVSEVMECYLMTGEADYQLRVFLRHKLARIAGVSQVTSSFVFRPVGWVKTKD